MTLLQGSMAAAWAGKLEPAPQDPKEMNGSDRGKNICVRRARSLSSFLSKDRLSLIIELSAHWLLINFLFSLKSVRIVGLCERVYIFFFATQLGAGSGCLIVSSAVPCAKQSWRGHCSRGPAPQAAPARMRDERRRAGRASLSWGLSCVACSLLLLTVLQGS